MIFRKSSEISPVVKEKPHGGKGSMTMYAFASEREAHNAGRLFAKITMPPGASIGMHEHVGEFEIYYVISGTGLVNDGEKDYAIGPGDVYLCDDGERHSLENTGDEELAIVAIIPYIK